jgi:hypothetical protein
MTVLASADKPRRSHNLASSCPVSIAVHSTVTPARTRPEAPCQKQFIPALPAHSPFRDDCFVAAGHRERERDRPHAPATRLRGSDFLEVRQLEYVPYQTGTTPIRRDHIGVAPHTSGCASQLVIMPSVNPSTYREAVIHRGSFGTSDECRLARPRGFGGRINR